MRHTKIIKALSGISRFNESKFHHSKRPNYIFFINVSFSLIDVALGIGFVNSEGDTGFPSLILMSPFEMEIMVVRFSGWLLRMKWKMKEEREQ